VKLALEKAFTLDHSIIDILTHYVHSCNGKIHGIRIFTESGIDHIIPWMTEKMERLIMMQYELTRKRVPMSKFSCWQKF
jgi:hypothetical protein